MRRHSSNPPLVFLIAVSLSCLLLQQQTCSGSEDGAFRRAPPPPGPPPGSPFSAVAERGAANENDTNDDNPVGNSSGEGYGYGYTQQQQPQQQQEEISSSSYPSRYPDKYNSEYGNNNIGGSPQGPSQAGPYSSSVPQREQKQQQNPSFPIHYDFPMAGSDNEMDAKGGGREQRQRQRNDGDREEGLDGDGMTSSARKDLVTQYWATKKGKLQIQTIIGLVGYGLGNFVAKSVAEGNGMLQWSGYFWAAFLILSTWFRTPLGELSRAVGLSLILVLQRTQRIRKEYPTWRYVAASVGMLRGGPRDARGKPRGPRPFPPARNPWKYSPRSPRDPDFNMIYALVSMAIVGSTVGGNIPFIPNWIGALVGAATFAFACTWQESHRGDLARTMGMRVVRGATELWEIQADLQIIPKATVVSSQMIDKVMILDRKHRVKDRFLSLANKGYAQATKVADQIQQQQRGGNNKDENENDRDRNRERDRGRGRSGDRRDDDENDSRRGGRGRGRDEEGDRYLDRDDGGRRRDRDNDDNDRYNSHRDRRQPRRRYDDDDDDRDGDFGSNSRRRNEYDNSRDKYRRPKGNDDDNKNDSLDEKESDQKSKGFFFRRK